MEIGGKRDLAKRDRQEFAIYERSKAFGVHKFLKTSGSQNDMKNSDYFTSLDETLSFNRLTGFQKISKVFHVIIEFNSRKALTSTAPKL
jgi:hypothetical protein